MEKSNSLDVKNQQLLTDPAELIERIDQLEKELASRREIAVELAKSEERYALAIRGTHDGIWDWEIGTEDVFFSPRFKELLGYTGGEMSGNLPDFFSRLHPLDIKPTTEAIIAHLEEEKPYDIEYRLRHENGKYRWFHARGEAIRNEAGQPIRMSGAITDITQKKADELKLRLISNRLILATRAGKIGVWDYDIIKNVLVWDDMMYKVYGVDPKRFTVAYEAWEKGLHPDDREREREKLQSAIRGETEFDTDFRIIWPSDGSIHYIKANGIVVRDQSGQAIRMIGANWDITESRRIQEELHIARQKAEAAAKAKSEFLANMSHEIRTPMNGIMGFTELLLATDLDETQQEYLELMRQSSETLLTLINDILDFSKIEAGKLNLDLHDFQLRDMLADTLHPLSIKAADKGIEVALRIEPDVPDNLIGDSGRLRQIIVNLVGNGIKFTGNGEVVLRVSLDTRKKDKVTVHFFVSDTGIGIEPDKQKTIFDSFTQAEGSTTRHFGGTGLGLSICRRFVEMMGGEIQVESEPGKGSTFHFPINLEINHEALQPRASRKKLEGQPVLIVDDNATNRRILNDMLLSWKMRPELADSGTKGLKMLEKMDRSRPLPLILLDVMMPGMNGIEVAKKIAENFGEQRTGIIILSSAAHTLSREEMADLKIEKILRKPVKQSDLLDAVTKHYGATRTENIEQPKVRNRKTSETNQPLKILVAEDGAINRIVAVNLLESKGHTVSTAEDGAIAVKKFQEEDFDAILMDVMMPNLDGYGATTAIREIENRTGGHIPIIAMTANAMNGDRNRCLEAGMDGYVAKPFRPEELFATLESAV